MPDGLRIGGRWFCDAEAARFTAEFADPATVCDAESAIFEPDEFVDSTAAPVSTVSGRNALFRDLSRSELFFALLTLSTTL